MRLEETLSVRRARRQAGYDRLSGWYDRLAGRAERRLTERALMLLDPQPGERVLEIGPGTGHALKWLAKKVGEGGFAGGLDLSPGMLRQSQRRLERGERVDLVCGDALALPFRGGCFDMVLLSFTLELFEDFEMPAVLGACQRVLKQGGRLGAACLAQTEREGLVASLYRQAHAWFPALVDCHPIAVVELLEANGFIVQQAQASRLWGLDVMVVVGVL